MLLPPRLIASSLEGEVKSSQIQPNGIDLTIQAIRPIQDGGYLKRREVVLPSAQEDLLPDSSGNIALRRGECYDVRYLQTVKVPKGAAGIIIARPSLNRMGAFVTTGLYDSGFIGRLGCILRTNKNIKVQLGARLAQLIMIEAHTDHMYNGQYGERR